MEKEKKEISSLAAACPPHFYGGKPWRDDFGAVASHTYVLNQTATKTNMLRPNVRRVSTCGQHPNIP